MKRARTSINKQYNDITANTLEEAFAAIKTQYGVETLDALAYDVIQNEKTGVFGIIKPQKAVVRVYEPKRRKEKPQTLTQHEQQVHNTLLRDAVEHTVAVHASPEEPVVINNKTKKPKKGNVVADDDTNGLQSSAVTEVIQPKSTVAVQKENSKKKLQQKKKNTKNTVQKTKEPVYASTSIEGRSLLHTSTKKKKNVLVQLHEKKTGNAKLITLVSEILLRIMQAFGIEAPYNITLEDQNRLHVAIKKSKKTACLLGEDNEVLRAIQYILYRILTQQSENEILLTITLGEHKVSEETIFEANIRKLCKKVLSTKQPVQTYQLSQEQCTKACAWIAEEKNIAYTVTQEEDKYTVVLSYKE